MICPLSGRKTQEATNRSKYLVSLVPTHGSLSLHRKGPTSLHANPSAQDKRTSTPSFGAGPPPKGTIRSRTDSEWVRRCIVIATRRVDHPLQPQNGLLKPPCNCLSSQVTSGVIEVTRKITLMTWWSAWKPAVRQRWMSWPGSPAGKDRRRAFESSWRSRSFSHSKRVAPHARPFFETPKRNQ